MGLKNWIGGVLGSPDKKVSASRFVEARGVTVEEDMDGWRKLSDTADRDLNPTTQRRMRDLAVYLWKTNPLANRLVELPLAYLLAEGVRLVVPDEEAQGWINAFWRDPINRMDIKLPKKMRELSLYGEQCWPAFVNEANGHVRLGYLDPGQIENVVTDPDNIEQPIGIVTVRNRHGVKRRYRIIVNGPEDVFTERTRQIRESFGDGDCFYFPVNNLSNATRGHSDLLAQMDWLDAYDHALFGEVERWDFLRAFIYDVTLKGATPEEVEKRAGRIAPPKPGSVRVHNDGEQWEALAPSLGSYESESNARLFRNHIMGGRTIPEHWFGGGGDVNRATAGEMGEPTFKVFTMRQSFLGYILEEIGTYQIRQRLRILYGAEPEASNHLDDYVVTAEFPEMTARDTSKYATALQQVVMAAATAIDRNLLSEETAVGIIALVAGQLGKEVDPTSELVAARTDMERRREHDNFPGLDVEEA